jgi:hypothetical protein
MVVGVVVAPTMLATDGEALLPAIMQGSHYTPAMIFGRALRSEKPRRGVLEQAEVLA